MYRCTSKFRKRQRLGELNLKVLITTNQGLYDHQSRPLSPPTSTKFVGFAINHLIIPEPIQGYAQI